MTNARIERLPDEFTARGWRLSVRAVELGAAALDAAIIICLSILVADGFHLFAYGDHPDAELYLGVGGVFAALLVPRKWFQGHYRPNEMLDFRRQVMRLIPEWLFTLVLLALIAFGLKAGADFSRGATLSFAILGLSALIGMRAVWRAVLQQALAKGLLRGKLVALVGNGDEPLADERVSTLREYGYEIATYVALPATNLDGGQGQDWRSILASIHNEICGPGIEEILIDLEWTRARSLIATLERFRAVPLPVFVVPDQEIARLLLKSTRRFGSHVAVEVQRAPLNLTERACKRCFDVGISATSLLLLTPLLLAIAILIKLDTTGPVLFRQTRRGFNGRPFSILKFRTMTVMEDGDVVVQARRWDPRVTRVGNFLRRSSIDELPQLINVLLGEMSIVGPRPHAMAHDSYYDKIIANYAVRHHVKPGLTGWAQVNGYRGETPTDDLMCRRVELDLWYVDNWSLALDLRIVLRTVFELFRNPNAY